MGTGKRQADRQTDRLTGVSRNAASPGDIRVATHFLGFKQLQFSAPVPVIRFNCINLCFLFIYVL